MKKMTDGLNLKISEILNESYVDIHGHEITFEKTGKFEYTSVYNINCNRKYIIDLSPATVSVKELTIPSEDVVYMVMTITLVSTKNVKHKFVISL